MKWNYVKGEILQRGMTIRQVARMIGFKESIVTKTLEGIRHGQQIQEAVADLLGIPSVDLFGSSHWTRFKPVADRMPRNHSDGGQA